MAGSAALGTLQAFAQNRSAGETGGNVVALSVGQSVEYVDGTSDEDGTRAITRLGLSMNRATATQTLSFSARSGIEIGDDEGEDFVDPVLRLAYTLRAANSRLSFNGNYRRTDLDETTQLLRPVENPNQDPDTLADEIILQEVAIEQGDRIDALAQINFQTGLQDPVGFTLDASRRIREFEDTFDSSLFDTVTDNVTLGASFQIDPRITARLDASQTIYDAEDPEQTYRTTTSYGASTVLQVDKLLLLTARLGHRRVETERTTGDTAYDGLTYSLDATRSMKNGSIGAVFDSTITAAGRRSSLSANRALTLRRGADISVSAGVVETEDDTISPIFALNWRQPLKTGSFTFSLSQQASLTNETSPVILTDISSRYTMPLSDISNLSFGLAITDIDAVDDVANERRRIELSGDYSAQLTNRSSWSFGVTASRSDIDRSGSVTETEDRLSLNLSYRHSLPRDWDFVSRVQYTEVENNISADRSIQRVSLGLERTFSWRP